MKDLATNPRLNRQRPTPRLASRESLAKGHRAPILPDPRMGAVASPLQRMRKWWRIDTELADRIGRNRKALEEQRLEDDAIRTSAGLVTFNEITANTITAVELSVKA